LNERHEASVVVRPGGDPNSVAARAKRWLISHYPLLGSLLTQFDLVEDAAVCGRLRIGVAAIHVGLGEIYINPGAHLSLEGAKFVLAHEVLHAGLSHAARRQGRDPYLWNVACDFVINDWLVTMGLGVPPAVGLLFDEELRGWPAEDIYLRLAADLRVRRRLCTLRGDDVDMLDDGPGGYFTDREAFCRRALLEGLDYHQAAGRGTLPGGLVEAIRTLNQPPIPWQARLAEWIRERFPLPERHRSYARPSRRQSATPDIPRPRFVEPEDERATRTFGVVLDSSGSMEREVLGKALDAVRPGVCDGGLAGHPGGGAGARRHRAAAGPDLAGDAPGLSQGLPHPRDHGWLVRGRAGGEPGPRVPAVPGPPVAVSHAQAGVPDGVMNQEEG